MTMNINILKTLVIFIPCLFGLIGLEAQPQGLTAVPMEKSIKLVWNSITSNTDKFRTYNVYVGTTPNPTTVATITNYGVAADTSVIIGNLINYSTYYIRVAAAYSDNTVSAYSTEVQSSPIDLTPCETPQNVSIVESDQTLSITWDHIANNGGDFKEYKIYIGTEPTELPFYKSTTENNLVINGLTNNLRYFARVVSVDLNGNESLYPTINFATPLPVESESNDYFSNAENVSASFFGSISVNDMDCFKLQFKTNALYRFRLIPVNYGNGTLQYPLLQLFSKTDTINPLAGAVTANASGEYLIEYLNNNADSYYLKIRPTEPGFTGDYKLHLSECMIDTYEGDDNFTVAQQIANFQFFQDRTIFPAGDNDYYRFNGNVNQKALIVLFSNDIQTKISIYDGSFQLLKEYTTASKFDSVSYRLPDTGGYYFKIASSDNFNTGIYSCRLRLLPPNDLAKNGATYSLGWTETFNTAAWTNNWDILDYNADYKTWEIYSTLGVNGTTALGVSYSETGNNDWLITPILNIADNQQLKYYAKATSGNTETVELYVLAMPSNSTSDFVNVKTENFANAQFAPSYLSLADYSGKKIRVAFRQASVNKGSFMLDDVSLENIPYNNVLQGTISDLTTNLPLAGAIVAANGTAFTTTADGKYKLENLPAGEIILSVGLSNYQIYTSSLLITDNSTAAKNIKLAQLQPKSVYYSGFETGNDLGNTDFPAVNGWNTSNAFVSQGNVIKPASGNSMLVFGGSNSYPQTVAYFWGNKTPQSFDLSAFESATLQFSAIYDLEDKADKIFPVISVSGGNFSILDLNNNGIEAADDCLTGQSLSWNTYSINLTKYCNTQSGKNIKIGFVALTNNVALLKNWGAAFDEIRIEGNETRSLGKVVNLAAQSYLDDKVPLKWDAINNALAYNIFRKKLTDNVFSLLSTSLTADYEDVAVENGQQYQYEVSAIYDYGESLPCDFVMAWAGKPIAIPIYRDIQNNIDYQYVEEFITYQTLPDKWGVGFPAATKIGWQVGNQLNASSALYKFPAIENIILYLTDKTPNQNDILTDISVITPFFDISKLSSNLNISFKTISKTGLGEKHYVLMRGMNDLQWVKIDSIANVPAWQLYNIVVPKTTVANVQFAFQVINSANDQNAGVYGWGIDSVVVADRALGSVAGKVLSVANRPIFNAKVTLKQLGISTFTDREGNYSFINNAGNPFPIFANDKIDIDVSAYSYQTKTVTGILLTGNVVDKQDILLDVITLPPTALKMGYTESGKPVISWKEPERFGTLMYDTRRDTVQVPYPVSLATFKTDVPVPFKLKTIKILIAKGQLDKQFDYVEIRTKPKSGAVKSLLKKTNVKLDSLYDEGNYLWAGIPCDIEIDTTVFEVEFKNAATPFLIMHDFLSPLNMQYWNGSYWANTDWNWAVRCELDLGAAFLHKYNIYRKTSLTDDYTLIAENVPDTKFTDNTIFASHTAYYAVKAIYDVGASDYSENIKYDIPNFAYIATDLQKIEKTFESTDLVAQSSLQLSNKGTSDLYYQINYFAGYAPNVRNQVKPLQQDDPNWARLKCFDKQPIPGDTTEITLYLECENRGKFKVSHVDISFGEGINVLSSTNFIEIGANNYLNTNNAVGNAAILQWFDPDGGFGNILGNQVAAAKVKLVVDKNFKGTYNQTYSITGDLPFFTDNTVTGTLAINPYPFTVATDQAAGLIYPNGTVSATARLNFAGAKYGFFPGYFTISSNAANLPELTIPYNITVKRPECSVSVLVPNFELASQFIEKAKLTLADAAYPDFKFEGKSDVNGMFTFTNVPISKYLLTVSKPDFADTTVVIALNTGDKLVNRNIALRPDVREPQRLTLNANIQDITLNWLPKTIDVLEDFTGTENTPINNWKTYDNNNDGKTWSYGNEAVARPSLPTSASVNSGSGANDDYLVSPALQITEKSVLKFWVSPYSTDFPNESFRVLISHTGDKPENFTDVLLDQPKFNDFGIAEKNNYGKIFSLQLGSYAQYENTWVAFQYYANGQHSINIDDVEISNLLQKPVTLNIKPEAKVLQNFSVYRADANPEFSLIATVPANITKFTDSQAIAGQTYTYKVKGVYDIGISGYSNGAMATITNYAPTIAVTDNLEGLEDQTISIPLNYGDPNGTNNLTLKAVAVIDRFTFTIRNDSLFAQPQKDWNGSSQVSVIVSDGYLTDTTSFMVKINPVNDPPAIASFPQEYTLTGQLYQYQIKVFDADNDNLVVTVEKPQWLAFNSNTLLLSGTPTIADAGNVAVKVTVKDAIATVSQVYNLKVTLDNYPPVFTSTPITTVKTGANYRYKITASDLNSDALIFNAIQIPNWLTLVDTAAVNTVILKGTAPTNADNVDISLSVFDGKSPKVVQQFTLTVMLTTGISALKENNLGIYPNPASDYVHIQGITTDLLPVRIEILDVLGKPCFYKTVYAGPNIEISVSQLNVGLYTIKLSHNDQTLKYKFIKR